MSANPALDAALVLAGHGFAVFRVKSGGKVPDTAHGHRDAVLEPAAVTAMFAGCPRANIGIRTGAESNIVVLDIDSRHGGDESLAKFEKRHGALPTTVACATGGGGQHIYFRHPGEPLKNRAAVRPGLDVRGDGGYVVAPPSTHASGTAYSWAEGRAPGEIEIAPLPPALEKVIRSRTKTVDERAKKYISKCEPVVEGERNNQAFKISGHIQALADGDGCFLEPEHVVALMREWNAGNQPPLEDEELLRCIENSTNHGTPPPTKGPTGGGGGEHHVPAPKVVPVASGSLGSAPQREWPEFEPLKNELPAVDPFDPELLPEAFRVWLTDVAERMQCPFDYVGAAAIVAVAAVVGRKVAIHPKRRDDWQVVPNLWGAIIGRPGLLKTPAVQEVLRPLQHLEYEEKKKYEAENLKRLGEQVLERAQSKIDEKAIKTALEGGDKTEAKRIADEQNKEPRKIPTRKRFLVNDATVEKLGELLNENTNGVLVFRDELMGLVRSMDKEGHECDRAFYLEAWNGNSRFTYDRIARGTIDIEAAIISIFGCVQPGPLTSHLQAAMDGAAADDGFIQRFQVIVWPDVSPHWKNVDRYPDCDARKRAHDVFVDLEGLKKRDFRYEEGKFAKEDDIPGLRFEPAAQQVFDAWYEGLELRLRSGQEHPAIESHFAKYRSLIPSIALLQHLVDGGRGPVTVAALERALKWAKYLESHARRVYSLGAHGDVTAAKAIERRIRKGALKDGFTLRDVYRPQWTGLMRREDAERGVALLVDLGWLRTEIKKTPGASKTEYRIHPEMLRAGSSPEGTAKTDEGPVQDEGFL